MLSDLSAFVAAVFEKWATLATGGIVMAVVWFYTAYTSQSPPRRVNLALAVAFVLLALFQVWADQYHQADALRRSLDESRAQLSALQLPDLRADIQSLAIGQFSAFPNATMLTLVVGVRNVGADSIADNWRMMVTVAGQEYGADHLAMPPQFTLQGYEGHPIRYTAADSLASKVVSTPIPRGGQVVGVLIFRVRGVPFERMQAEDQQHRVSYHLTYRDVLHRTQTAASIEGAEQDNIPRLYPGTGGTFVESSEPSK